MKRDRSGEIRVHDKIISSESVKRQILLLANHIVIHSSLNGK